MAVTYAAQATDARRLNDEYQRLVSGLASGGALSGADDVTANPVLPDEILTQAVPGNLRRADSFVTFLRRLVEHLKKRMAVGSVLQESPTAFLLRLSQESLPQRSRNGHETVTHQTVR